MIPVLYKFVLQSTTSQVFGYLLGLGLAAYVAWSGWRGAHGPANTKTGEFDPPTRDDRIRRAAMFGLAGLGLAALGLYYALPTTPFGKGKGEGIPIHTYGVLVGGGFIAAVTVSAWLAQREWLGEEGEKKRDQIFDLAFWVFIGGIVGSRILFIIVNWKDYAADPKRIFDISGGLVFYGGLIGAAVVAFVYARKHEMDFLRLADVAIPTVSLGQCLGRLGCFSAGCCWGDVAPKGFALGVNFPGPGVKDLFGSAGGTPSLAYTSQAADTRYVIEATGEIFHQAVPGAVKISEWASTHGHTLLIYPTQLFESVGQLVLFVALLTLRRYRRFHGQIFGIWLMCYAVLRSSVELFRGDVERGTLHGLLNYLGATSLAQKVPLEAWYNISTSQFISMCMFALGATIVVRKAKEVLARPPLVLEPAPAAAS
ncbi:MAG: prolipoprotein diacylglyceryl transferase [Myxococcota bacterium]